jgi:hypothetical protein
MYVSGHPIRMVRHQFRVSDESRSCVLILQVSHQFNAKFLLIFSASQYVGVHINHFYSV